MSDIRFKPRHSRAATTGPEMALYLRQIAADNSGEHSRLKRNLIRAIREEITPRQRQMLTMYYVENKRITQIAKELEVCPSTVHRTLRRGEQRLFRCLRYGAGWYLMGEDEEEP